MLLGETLSGEIFVTSQKIRHFRPTKFRPIRYEVKESICMVSCYTCMILHFLYLRGLACILMSLRHVVKHVQGYRFEMLTPLSFYLQVWQNITHQGCFCQIFSRIYIYIHKQVKISPTGEFYPLKLLVKLVVFQILICQKDFFSFFQPGNLEKQGIARMI